MTESIKTAVKSQVTHGTHLPMWPWVRLVTSI